MISIRSLLESKAIYVLCVFLFIAVVMQIESHVGTLELADGTTTPCPDCPDADSDDTVCLTCHTLHYDENHKHGPPIATPDVVASACAGAYRATGNIDLSLNNIRYAEAGWTYRGSARGRVGFEPYFPNDALEIKVVEGWGEWTISIPLMVGGQKVQIGIDIGHTWGKAKLKTDKDECNVGDWFSPRYRSSAWISGRVAGEGKSDGASTAAYYRGEFWWQCDSST